MKQNDIVDGNKDVNLSLNISTYDSPVPKDSSVKDEKVKGAWPLSTAHSVIPGLSLISPEDRIEQAKPPVENVTSENFTDRPVEIAAEVGVRNISENSTTLCTLNTDTVTSEIPVVHSGNTVAGKSRTDEVENHGNSLIKHSGIVKTGLLDLPLPDVASDNSNITPTNLNSPMSNHDMDSSPNGNNSPPLATRQDSLADKGGNASAVLSSNLFSSPTQSLLTKPGPISQELNRLAPVTSFQDDDDEEEISVSTHVENTSHTFRTLHTR